MANSRKDERKRDGSIKFSILNKKIEAALLISPITAGKILFVDRICSSNMTINNAVIANSIP